MRNSIKWPFFGILGSVVFGLAPVGVTLLAAGIAKINNCQLNEGSATPCIIAGVDFAETLYAMVVVSWLGLITIPIGVIGATAFLVWLIVATAKSKHG